MGFVDHGMQFGTDPLQLLSGLVRQGPGRVELGVQLSRLLKGGMQLFLQLRKVLPFGAKALLIRFSLHLIHRHRGSAFLQVVQLGLDPLQLGTKDLQLIQARHQLLGLVDPCPFVSLRRGLLPGTPRGLVGHHGFVRLLDQLSHRCPPFDLASTLFHPASEFTPDPVEFAAPSGQELPCFRGQLLDPVSLLHHPVELRVFGSMASMGGDRKLREQLGAGHPLQDGRPLLGSRLKERSEVSLSKEHRPSKLVESQSHPVPDGAQGLGAVLSRKFFVRFDSKQTHPNRLQPAVWFAAGPPDLPAGAVGVPVSADEVDFCEGLAGAPTHQQSGVVWRHLLVQWTHQFVAGPDQAGNAVEERHTQSIQQRALSGSGGSDDREEPRLGQGPVDERDVESLQAGQIVAPQSQHPHS